MELDDFDRRLLEVIADSGGNADVASIADAVGVDADVATSKLRRLSGSGHLSGPIQAGFDDTERDSVKYALTDAGRAALADQSA